MEPLAVGARRRPPAGPNRPAPRWGPSRSDDLFSGCDTRPARDAPAESLCFVFCYIGLIYFGRIGSSLTSSGAGLVDFGGGHWTAYSSGLAGPKLRERKSGRAGARVGLGVIRVRGPSRQRKYARGRVFYFMFAFGRLDRFWRATFACLFV